MAIPFLQLTINSLITGSIFALVAVGFSLIYQTNRFMHFAHGSAVVLGAYFVYLFFTVIGLPFTIACILTIITSVIAGYLMHKLVYLPLQKRNSSNIILLIASFGILILVENLILLGFGADVKRIGLIETSKGIEIGSALITPLQIAIIVTALVAMILTYLFMNKTKWGRNLRAVADHKELASIMGINAENYMALSFIIGSALAGVAGILIGLEQSVIVSMGTNLIIKGFSGAVIGGITSVPASIVGSFIVGFAENFGIWWIPSGYKNAITFTLLFLFLLFRPQGLFGVDRGLRK